MAKGISAFKKITQKEDTSKQQQSKDRGSAQYQPFKEDNWTNTIKEYENTLTSSSKIPNNNNNNTGAYGQYNANSYYLGKIDLGNVIEVRRGATDLKNVILI